LFGSTRELERRDPSFRPEFLEYTRLAVSVLSFRYVLGLVEAQMKPGDSFFTLDPYPSWYYLLDRPCPTRFPIAFLAAPPEFQREIIRQLESSEVRFVLYMKDRPDRSTSYTSPRHRIHNIPHTERLPILVRYLRSKHRVQKRILDHEIWIRAASRSSES
jgi:hypothetical protein